MTEKDKVVVKHGVTLIGYTDLPSRLANQSSQLYATNLRHFLTDLTPAKDGIINVNMDDEVIRGATVVKEGKITWPPPPPTISVAPQAKASEATPLVAAEKKPAIPPVVKQILILLTLGAALFWVGANAPAAFMSHFTVFILACFVGYQVIWNVTPALHTPLMSVTNAISGIIVIGALVQVSTSGFIVTVLAGLGILLASINIAGGFLVTRRMLEMFRK